MAVIDRTLWFNGLVDDDGSGTTGTLWQKSEVGKLLDSIDAALSTSGFSPSAHATTHKSGGTDPIKLDELAAPTDIVTLNASLTTHGLLTKLSGLTNQWMRGDGLWAGVGVLQLVNYPGGTTTFLRADGTFSVPSVSAHATTHKAGGSDVIKLDELAAPTDVTTLNASTTAHGLLAKLPGNTTTYLRGDGTFAAVTGGAHATTHAAGGGDTVDIKTLGGYPGNTTTFLRGDGQFVVPPGGGSGGGNVNGPGTSVVGNVVKWNDATGTSISDTGIAASALVVTTDTRLTNARTPTAHATTHNAGGSDQLDVKALGGFDGTVQHFLSGQQTFITPSIASMAGFPPNTTTFLRGDGTFSDTLTGNAAVNGSFFLGANMTFNSNATITRNTVDGADTGYLIFTAGGAAAASRGALFIMYGNESAAPGNITFVPGNVAGAVITFYRGDSATPILALDATTGVSTWTSGGAQGWIFNSTVANGSYFAIQKAGTNLLQIGPALAMGVGAGNDTIIKSMQAGALFIESVTGIKSTSVYADTTASAANVFIQSDGRIQRSTSSLRYKSQVTPMVDAEWRWLLDAQPITFAEQRNPTGRRFGGLAAEDVAARAPMFAVFNDAGLPDEVAYGHLTAPIICALQHLSARLQRIEDRSGAA